MINLTNADAALKEYYLDAVTHQLNEGVSPFFSAIEKTAQYVYGKNARCALVRGDMNRIVTGDEDGDLPDASGNNYYDVSLPLKNIYGTIAVTDKAVRASQDSSGAFVNLLNAEMEGLVADAKANFSRMLFGDGNGQIAYITKANSATNFTLNNVKSWFKGLTVDIANALGTEASVKNLKITAVDTENSTITVSASVANHTSYVGFPVVISGAQVAELEQELAAYVGAKNCVSCANGTDALSIAMMAWLTAPAPTHWMLTGIPSLTSPAMAPATDAGDDLLDTFR